MALAFAWDSSVRRCGACKPRALCQEGCGGGDGEAVRLYVVVADALGRFGYVERGLCRVLRSEAECSFGCGA